MPPRLFGWEAACWGPSGFSPSGCSPGVVLQQHVCRDTAEMKEGSVVGPKSAPAGGKRDLIDYMECLNNLLITLFCTCFCLKLSSVNGAQRLRRK